jgi:hypothetical protein
MPSKIDVSSIKKHRQVGWSPVELSAQAGRKPTISILPLPQSSLLQETHPIGRHRHLTHRKTANCNCQNTHPLKYLETNPPPTKNSNPKHHCIGISQITKLPTSASPPCGVDPLQKDAGSTAKAHVADLCIVAIHRANPVACICHPLR